MNNTQLRDSLLSQADAAFLKIVDHVDILLDMAQFFGDRYPVVTPSDKVKSSQLNVAVKDLGSLTRQLAEEIGRWKREDDRILSRLGVEIQVLNELYSTMVASMLFFIMQDIDLKEYSNSAVQRSITELVRCNRLL